MKIAVLSGKGGTGKTFVSVNLACAAEQSDYMDCDVEEPNGHLFLKPEIISTLTVEVMLPKVDVERCSGCKVCVDFCKFNALAYVNGKLLHFKEVCHACGGCVLLCPEDAMTYAKRNIGVIHEGISGRVKVLTGILNTGEVSGIPIIKKMMEKISDKGLTIIDCPPGSACIVMESIKNADYCILVAEPTIFGENNLAMVYELVKLFGKRTGVVLNKCLTGENPSKKYCDQNYLKILAEIPYYKEIASMTSNGEIAVRKSDGMEELFKSILRNIERETH